VTHAGRATRLAALLGLLAAPAGAGEAPPLVAPNPASFRVYDRPSDGGNALAVEWAKSPSEGDGALYIVEIAPQSDATSPEAAAQPAAEFRKAAEIPSQKSFKADAPKYFGFRKRNEDVHYVSIEPARLYPPDEQAVRRKVVERQGKRMGAKWNPDEDYPQRLATLSASTAVVVNAVKAFVPSSAPSTAAPPAAAAADEEEPSPEAKAKQAGQSYLKALEALQTHLDKATETLLAAERPRIADTSYMKTLEATRSAVDGALRQRDAYRLAARQANADALAALDEAERGFLMNVKQYRAYAKRLRKFEAYVATEVTDAVKAEARRINRQRYVVRLAISDGQRTVYVEEGGAPKLASSRARVNFFKGFKLNNLLFSLIFSGIVIVFIQMARRNPDLFIRKIAGLDAVEEAIGRATEMGRSVFFVHGLTGVGSLSTIAALNILGRVARRSAEYDTRVKVMNRDPIVMAVSQEVVKQSYTEAGRPDAYNDDDVALAASDQFSYVAAVGGRMVRERPAAIFLMGYFYAESLLLAETGASTGAIQIAGTDSYTQVPFFITTCDYTLIGEELYAASAYLSREPKMLGSLRGQDVGKAFMMLVIVAFTGLATMAALLATALPLLKTLVEYWANTLFQPFS